jgi:hypothetical protein
MTDKDVTPKELEGAVLQAYERCAKLAEERFDHGACKLAGIDIAKAIRRLARNHYEE